MGRAPRAGVHTRPTSTQSTRHKCKLSEHPCSFTRPSTAQMEACPLHTHTHAHWQLEPIHSSSAVITGGELDHTKGQSPQSPSTLPGGQAEITGVGARSRAVSQG